MTARALLAAVVLGLVAPVAAAAQSLEARVAAAPDGDVRFSFTSRPDVIGNSSDADGDDPAGLSDGRWRSACDTGPVRVTLRRRDRHLTALRVAVGGHGAAPTGTDLGRVAAPDAVRYLLALTARADGDLGGQAIFAATLADSVTIWPDLLRLARNRAVPEQTRRSAVFWVSQAAEAAATQGLDSLVAEDATDREVREQAVFALSQRPREEGVPVLIRIARSHRDSKIRRRAIFWLGQSEDPRVLALFEELLTGP
jgi:hypothetical protein